MTVEIVLKDSPVSTTSINTRIAIFTLDSLYSNYALKNIISLLKDRVEIVFCTERVSNKKYGSFSDQAAKIIKKSGLYFFIYLNLYVFLYRFFIYFGALYRRLIGKKIKAFSLEWMARRYGFRIIKVDDINSDAVSRNLKKSKIDTAIGIHLDQLVSKDILSIPQNGCLNMHYGELPGNAGPFPSIWAALREKKASSVTIHYMNNSFDKGDILAEAVVPFVEGDSILSFDCRLHKVGGKLLQNVVLSIEKGEQAPKPQTHENFRYKSYPTRKHIKILKKRNIKLFHWKEFFQYFF